MYELSDTIVAISSGANFGPKTIFRVSGPSAGQAVDAVFSPAIKTETRGVYSGCVEIDSMQLEAFAYVYPQGRSYTGDLLVEISVYCSEPVAELILNRIASNGARLAGPGEFTARAYLNGKIDLAQAEAVAEIVASSNRFQLEAAEKLLEGKLSDRVDDLRSRLLDVMSLIEAEMDFCEEGVMFVSSAQAIERLDSIESDLISLLNGSIAYQAMISLPSVGIAGTPNAGKSSLLNSLLGQQRSIVSGQRATTRDILTAQLDLPNNDCVIFDCAGLSIENKVDVIDEIAQLAAIEAINSAGLVVFCVDLSSDDHKEQLQLLNLIKTENIIFVATKADCVEDYQLRERLEALGSIFKNKFLPTSSQNSFGMENLKAIIDEKLLIIQSKLGDSSESVAVNKRHRDSVESTLQSIAQAKEELQSENFELAAMILRDAFESLAGVEQSKTVDEMMLDRIFSQFCIGK